jgi:hypothetical protein
VNANWYWITIGIDPARPEGYSNVKQGDTMKRNLFSINALILILAVIMVPCGAFAQQGSSGGTFTEQELDQMCAPIALYPDSLLAQVLLAATYPDQITEADHWMKANPNIRGESLNDSLDSMNWDLSVKALAPFPQVLAMLDEKPEWTERLGEAFLTQQADVMDCIQKLRAKAHAAGNLRPTAEQNVIVKGDSIEIVPANPEIVYVPRYNPVVVYGSWWWPTYPPYVYAPVYPGVVVGSVGVFGFWGAVTVGPVWGWGWGSWGWHSHDVNINVNRNININRTTNVNINRNNFRTTSFRQTATAGHFGSGKPHAAALSRTGMAGSGPGRVRPSSASVQQGLKASGTGASAGKFNSGAVTTKSKTGSFSSTSKTGGVSSTGKTGYGNSSQVKKNSFNASGAGSSKYGNSSTRSNRSNFNAASGGNKAKFNQGSSMGSKARVGRSSAMPKMSKPAAAHPAGNFKQKK